MEENIHDDKLDDYVRKSFDGYEEDPDSDMWNRVEARLSPAPAPVLLPVYRRYGWQLLAATVIVVLFSTLVCEHLYYEDKLRSLTSTPQHETEQQLKQVSGDKPAELVVQSTPATARPTVEQPKTTPAKNPDASILLPVQKPSQQAHVKAEVSLKNIDNQIDKPKNSGKGNNLAIVPTPSMPAQERNIVASNPSIQFPDPNTVTALPTPEKSSTMTQRQATPILISCMPTEIGLFDIPEKVGFMQISSSPALTVSAPIQPHKPAAGNWYLGLQTSVFSGYEKSGTVVSRPGRHVFLSEQKGTAPSTAYWLKVGKRINATFGLETGLGYQNLSRTATHTPRFRFGDGRPGQLGAPRSFDYDLNTYGGTAEVSLRMEATTPMQPSDDEQVPLVITTTEQTDLLRVPLLASVHLGKRQLNWVLKAGLVGNFVLKNELDISASVSENARFRPVAGKDGYSIALKSGKFFMGYWLSAGMEYKFNQQFSLVAEPSLMGDFPRNDNFRQRKPQRYLLGLNVGANYYF